MSTEIYLPHVPESAAAERGFSATHEMWWPTPARIPQRESQATEPFYQLSPWCASAWKHAFDLFCVIPALILLSPALGIIAAAVRLSSSGPVIFRQARAGRNRKLFTIYKFRTMIEHSERIGPGHTAKGDPRITRVGNLLRRFKLDELPQLYNVLLGDMSLVGPRPKLPQHDQTTIRCRPGITGAATLAFRDEQRILSEVPADRLEDFYQAHVVPCKLRLDADYMSRATVATDIKILCATILKKGQHLTHQDLFLAPSRHPVQNPEAVAIIARLN